MMSKKTYLTYDLEESGSATPKETYRAAHELPIQIDSLIRFRVGEFKRAWGRDIYGVKIWYRPSGSSSQEVCEEIVEVPANARNVQIHVGSLPREYQDGLMSAA